MEAFRLLCRTEESCRRSRRRTSSLVPELGRDLGPDGIVLVNLSGRGDKDVDTAARWFGLATST